MKASQEDPDMILNLKVTVTPTLGREPEQVADVNIVVAEAALHPTPASRYVLECKDAADATLGKAVADGLVVKHILDVDEEPDC